MKTDLAPIAFFAYRRPEHTFQSLCSLSQCDLASESELYIFCDGARDSQDWEKVSQVRDVVKSQQWCGEDHIILSGKNMGLAHSVISGVSTICERHGRVIVVEDDLILSPSFLRYMNVSLERYGGDEAIMQISGYMFPVEIAVSTDAIFLPFTTSWGWATWQQAWLKFDREMKGYKKVKKDRALRRRFNLDGTYNFFRMLEKQRSGKIDSWAIQWYLSVFMMGGLILYPVQTLVRNVGLDGSGVHRDRERQTQSFNPEFKVRVFPSSVSISEAYATVRQHLMKETTLMQRFRSIFDEVF